MKVLLSLIFILLTNAVFAEDMRYYDVEIIVIENLKSNSAQSENWPVDINLTLPEKVVQFGSPIPAEWLPPGTDPAASYVLLNATDYRLTPQVEKISESKRQRVILHTAWRQPGLDKDLALPVYFKQDVQPVPVVEGAHVDNTALSQTEIIEHKTTPSVLEGILRVTLARYLHLEAEMTLRDKVSVIDNTAEPVSLFESDKPVQKQQVIYFNQERRRMRSTELHYLDHPVMSMLIQITPYEKTDEPVVQTPKKTNIPGNTIKR